MIFRTSVSHDLFVDSLWSKILTTQNSNCLCISPQAYMDVTNALF